MKNVIVIPIYKEQINYFEEASLHQCLNVFQNKDIVFVAPKSLNMKNYSSSFMKNYKVERFPDFFFKDISGYNSLMLAESFYARFKNYEYMLIYQLDCYVFRDELDIWCEKKFDYIGAPWLDYKYYNLTRYQKVVFQIRRHFNATFHRSKFDKTQLVNRVGNGGLSLRRISVFHKNCQNHNKNKKIQLFKESNDSAGLYNEDVYWSFFAKNIRKPNYKTAVGFAIDSCVPIGIRLNHNKTPFACHGWIRSYEFWKNYIEVNLP